MSSIEDTMALTANHPTAAELEIQRLQRQVSDLTNELKQAKEQSVFVQLQAEREEEAITLKLMRRLEQLKREKAALASEVEQEEEFLTNNLQKRLEKLADEKAQLETKAYELKKQMEQLESEKARLAKDKIDLEATLESESEYIVNKLQVQLEKLQTEKSGLQREKGELGRQVTELKQAVDKLNRDKVQLEQEMEMEEESIVNRLQRQLEAVLGSMRLIERQLEAKGITLRDLGITPFEFAPPETVRIYSRSPSSASSIDKWGHASPHASSSLGYPALGSSPSANAAHPLSTGVLRLSHRSSQRVSSGGVGAAGGNAVQVTSSGSITAGHGSHGSQLHHPHHHHHHHSQSPGPNSGTLLSVSSGSQDLAKMSTGSVSEPIKPHSSTDSMSALAKAVSAKK